MNPLKDLLDLLARLGGELPGWLVTVVLVLLVMTVANKILEQPVSLVRSGWSLVRRLVTRNNSAERRRQRRRGKLAAHLDNQLFTLELQEDWRDDKYAELEAEVEIERTRWWRWQARLLPFRKPSLYRARSLSKALAGPTGPLLLLEGEPGAGKSVALRHLARKLARRASRSGNPHRVIPLYLNLKALDVAPEAVSADRIRRFVLDTLTEVNNRDVAEVLDEEFDRGLDEGTWLLLFDSFDEIPDILSAPDARAVVPAYAQAIADFLAFTNCRGVVASRDFSSPDTIQFTRCRILRLSRKQQLSLIRRADLEPGVDRATREGLARASRDIATFAGNPMFLGLLCEHMRTAATFPTSSHAVFEEYLTHRLRRDVARVRSRFGVEVDFVRSGAEEIAYTMTATPRMGLEPARPAIRSAVQTFDRLGPVALDKILDVLEYTKLGRSGTNSHGEATFSFIHRRFQEYFATCLAIRDGTRVGVAELLEEDLWRETAVTLLQVQDGEATAPLLAEAAERLRAHVAELDAERFRWPEGCRHLLGILSAGLESRPEAVSSEMRGLVGKIVEPAWDRGHRLDRRHALRHAALAEPELTERLLVEAFAADNKYLRQLAFQVAGRLTTIGAPLRAQIRRTLVTLAARMEVTFQTASVGTEVRRLRRPAEFLSLIGLLRIAAPLAVVLPATACLAAILTVLPAPWFAALRVDESAVVPEPTEAVAAALPLGALALVVVLVAANALGVLDSAARSRSLVLLTALLNFGMCAAALVVVWRHWPGPPAGGIALLVLCGYAAFLPPATIWAAFDVRHSRPTLLPVLPAMFLAAALRGRMRLPASPAGGRTAVTFGRFDRKELAEISGVLLLMTSWTVLALGGGLALSGVDDRAGVLAGFVAIVAGAGSPALAEAIHVWSLRRATSGATTAGDVLDAFARARTDDAFTMLVNRFTAMRITRHPEIRKAVENLVGEVERAKRGRLGELVRHACPSLAARPVERNRLLDSYPFRWICSYRVRKFQESTLDDLARLAEQE